MNRKDFIKSGTAALSLGGLSKLSLSEKAKLAKPKVVRATDGKGTHVKRIFSKLEVHDRVSLTKKVTA